MRLHRDRLKVTTTLREPLSAERAARCNCPSGDYPVLDRPEKIWAAPTDAAFRRNRLIDCITTM